MSQKLDSSRRSNVVEDKNEPNLYYQASELNSIKLVCSSNRSCSDPWSTWFWHVPSAWYHATSIDKTKALLSGDSEFHRKWTCWPVMTMQGGDACCNGSLF